MKEMLRPLFLCLGVVGICLFYYGDAGPYRYGSFAPVHGDGNKIQWFVDGEDYMSAVADAIDKAEHEIFITDLQMNPDVFLKRPESGVDSLDWRLDKLLTRKAQTVQIYILLYSETKIDLGNWYVKERLRHPNINIWYHPTWSSWRAWRDLFFFSHHEKIVVVDRSVAFVGGIDLAFGRWDTHMHGLADDHPLHPCVEDERKCGQSDSENHDAVQLWPGKDYGNTFINGSRNNFDRPLKNYVDRMGHPRMPWHDVSCGFTGPAVVDVADHFIQRYNFISSQELPWQCMYHKKSGYNLPNPSGTNVKIQVVRSLARWSGGQSKEDSIHEAYLHTIKNSEYLIYIENQFFISSQKHKTVEVVNQIQQALYERIVKAHELNQDFHVFIVMPLQPEFDGDYGGGAFFNFKEIVTYWNSVTLISLIGKLIESNKMSREQVDKYLSVYGLRTHGTISNKTLVTELIYVHSKVMIVDDRITIVGSANINDRSMLGDRDSEVDVIIEDKEFINGTMNKNNYSVGVFSHGLRCHLFREHLGLLGNNEQNEALDPADPLNEKFFHRLRELASNNANVYETVFRSRILPTDEVTNLKELEQWKKLEGTLDRSPSDAKKELESIRGRIVTFPLQFLREYLKIPRWYFKTPHFIFTENN